jgi:ankyrin repeat protein
MPVEMLLAVGSDVEMAAWDGRTPLALAAAGGHAEVVRCLLRAKADVETQDDDASIVYL